MTHCTRCGGLTQVTEYPEGREFTCLACGNVAYPSGELAAAIEDARRMNEAADARRESHSHRRTRGKRAVV